MSKYSYIIDEPIKHGKVYNVDWHWYLWDGEEEIAFDPESQDPLEALNFVGGWGWQLVAIQGEDYYVVKVR